ncbi:MED14-domain-containing protein [Lichtheimia hyalospora FSU 10163]|nr:MED14-domain-containing protein [Lichtheimia hyalospora FSU 10163]
MVPLQLLIGKMVNKTYADLQTLTETLSSRGEVEKKRQILKYVTFNIMAFLANQNQFFYDATRFLNKIHVELPRARIRNFDIPTAVDVLTTGSYQRMPSKFKDMVPPSPLSDEEVLETFRKMNDVIRMRMLTTEILPSPMQHYRIESGRITFTIENEFQVSLTLMGPPSEQRWWIVSLDIQVKSTVGSGAADVDISLNEIQRQYLRVNAQKQLVPPQPQGEQTKSPLFFPLVNLHDYLHLFCLNMQLEIIYMQSTMVSKTRWLEQLKVQMDPTRNKLVLVYWKGGSPTAHWAHPQINMAISVRDDMRGLVQRAGLGASAMLSAVDDDDKPAVVSALQYPKNELEVLWGGFNDLHADKELLKPSDLNIERVLWHVTRHHSTCIIKRFRSLLKEQGRFLNDNGLHLIDDDVHHDDQDIPSIAIRYRHRRYITITMDVRTGRVKVRELGYKLGEGDAKLKELEERLNSDPENIARHLLWLRSEVVIREIVSLAKQLSLQPFSPSQMSLRPDDFIKLFGDLPTTHTSSESATTASRRPALYPSHCVFLQFVQFEDWYLVIAIVRNEVYSWLCCINKTYDQNGLFQVIVEMMHVEYDEMWKEHFLPKLDEDMDRDTSNKRRRSSVEQDMQSPSQHMTRKRRRTEASLKDTSQQESTTEIIDK